MNQNDLEDTDITKQEWGLKMNDKELLDYYWKYFEMYSKQRMQIINFFISIEIVLIGGFFYLISLKQRMTWADVITCIAIIVMDGVFWDLNQEPGS